MENNTNIRLELGIDARRMIQQVQINNRLLEDQIAEGIQLAIDRISNKDGFVQRIADATETAIFNLCNETIRSYEIKHKIQSEIEKHIGNAVNQYAEELSKKMLVVLQQQDPEVKEEK